MSYVQLAGTSSKADLLRKKFVLTLAQTVIHSIQDVKNSLKLTDVSNVSTKNTESIQNNFDFKMPPYGWCFFYNLFQDIRLTFTLRQRV